MRVIYTFGAHRIVEHEDTHYIISNLMEDCYPNFEHKVETEGVFGYELQVWDSAIGAGWTHIDSCFGFVGSYSQSETVPPSNNEHYIVQEFKNAILEEEDYKRSEVL